MKNSTFFISIIFSFLLFSCSSSKKLAHLQEENTNLKNANAKLKTENDSLTKELSSKSQALFQAQKTIAQYSAEKKKTLSARKRIESTDKESVSLFIRNIAKYVEWNPIDLEKYFLIGVVGDDQLHDKIISQFEGKQISGKPVFVRRMNSLKELETANLFFVSHSKLFLLPDIQKKASKNKALVISDANFNVEGVHINLYNENDSVHFEMNEGEIKKSKLTISSTLKSLQN